LWGGGDSAKFNISLLIITGLFNKHMNKEGNRISRSVTWLFSIITGPTKSLANLKYSVSSWQQPEVAASSQHGSIAEFIDISINREPQ